MTAPPPLCRCGHSGFWHTESGCGLKGNALEMCDCRGYEPATPPGGGEGLTPEDVARLREMLSESEAVHRAPWQLAAGGVDDASGDSVVTCWDEEARLLVALRNVAPALLVAVEERDAARAELAERTAERDRLRAFAEGVRDETNFHAHSRDKSVPKSAVVDLLTAAHEALGGGGG